jgi:hypothetical protein
MLCWLPPESPAIRIEESESLRAQAMAIAREELVPPTPLPPP